MIEVQEFVGVRMVRNDERVPIVLNVKEIVMMTPVKDAELVDITLTAISDNRNVIVRVAEPYQSLLRRIFGAEYSNLLPPQQ